MKMRSSRCARFQNGGIDETQHEFEDVYGGEERRTPRLRRGGFGDRGALGGTGTTGRDQHPTAVRKAEAGSLAHCFRVSQAAAELSTEALPREGSGCQRP